MQRESPTAILSEAHVTTDAASAHSTQPRSEGESDDSSKPLVPAIGLIGRRADIAKLRSLVAEQRARLMTLTGPDGIGKTRLVVATSEAVASSFRDGVTFVDVGMI